MRATELVALSSLVLSTTLAAACGSSSTAGGNGEGAGGDAGGPPTVTGGGVDSGAPSTGTPPPAGDDSGTAPPPAGDDSGATTSDDSGSGQDASTNPGDGGFVPVAHPPFPLLVNSNGPVLTAPQVLPVFFSNYDMIAKMTELVSGLPTAKLGNGASYWTGAVSEYGVGPLTVLPAVTVAQAAPTTDTDPVAFLQSQLGTAPFKNITPSTILAVFYPSTTPLGGSCAAGSPGWGGYHDAFTNGANQQPFAVMSECANFGPITSAADMVAVAASHEIIEASTDPYPSSSPAYASIDTTGGFAMTVLLQGNAENGDMCTINAGFGRGPAAFPFLLQRGWSNKAAQAGNLDPCSPDILPSQPFVGAFPVMPNTVNVAGVGAGPGVTIPVGSSKTIEVDLFSFQPTPEFTVLARQSSSTVPPTLTFAWDKTTGKNGDKLHLTITSVSAGLNGDAFLIVSELPGVSDPQKPGWAGVVGH